MDTALFSMALFLAHALRSTVGIEALGGDRDIGPFGNYVWLYLVVVPLVPVALEAQGFYQRTSFYSVWLLLWRLLRATSIIALILIVVIFVIRKEPAPSRQVVLTFGAIGFFLVAAKEAMFRLGRRSRFGRGAPKMRFLLVGALDDLRTAKEELRLNMAHEIDRVIELDASAASQERLVELLHSESINGVILMA